MASQNNINGNISNNKKPEEVKKDGSGIAKLATNPPQPNQPPNQPQEDLLQPGHVVRGKYFTN